MNTKLFPQAIVSLLLKSKALIGALLITNAFTWMMWFQTQQQAQRLLSEVRISSKQLETELDWKTQSGEDSFEQKIYKVCNGRKGTETSTQCELYKGSRQNE
jgi:hypothetical protein